MRFQKSLFSLSLAGLLGLNPTSAYVAEHLQSELAKQKSAPLAAAVLLNQEGEPRCKITGEHSEFLLSERFSEFVEANPEAGQALNEINALPECDKGDELYAEFELNPQEIELGMAAGGGTPGTIAAFIGTVWLFGGGITGAYMGMQEGGGFTGAVLGAIFVTPFFPVIVTYWLDKYFFGITTNGSYYLKDQEDDILVYTLDGDLLTKFPKSDLSDFADGMAESDFRRFPR